jgi:hypothetical protein
VTSPRPISAGLERPVEHAGLDLADGNLEFAKRVTDLLGLGAAGIVELALLGDVLGIEWIGVGLILVRGAMAEDDHMSALAHRADPFGLGARAPFRSRQERCRQGHECQTRKPHRHGSPSSGPTDVAKRRIAA